MDVGSTTAAPRPDPVAAAAAKTDPVAEAAKREAEAPKAEDPAAAQTEQPPQETGNNVDTVA